MALINKNKHLRDIKHICPWMNLVKICQAWPGNICFKVGLQFNLGDHSFTFHFSKLQKQMKFWLSQVDTLLSSNTVINFGLPSLSPSKISGGGLLMWLTLIRLTSRCLARTGGWHQKPPVSILTQDNFSSKIMFPW